MTRIIDSDGHIREDMADIRSRLPKSYADAFEGKGSNILPPIDHLHSQPMVIRGLRDNLQVGFDGWCKFLDELEIEATVLYPTIALSYGRINNYDWALTFARAYNDWLHETYLSRDTRFRGMALIPMQDPSAAVEELRRAVEELGMCGAMIPSNSLPLSLGSVVYRPVYEEADRLGCAISVHGGCHAGIGNDYANAFATAHALGHPVGQLSAAADLIMNGVFDRHPNVRFAFLEGGVAWLLVLLERLERSCESHTDIDARGEVLQLPDGEDIAAYLRRLIRDGRFFVGCEGSEPAIAYAVQSLGNALLFSTDYPHEITVESCRGEMKALTSNELLSEADKEAILATNGSKLYALR